MLKLDDRSISYLILSSPRAKDMSSYLYSKEYHLVEIKRFYQGLWEDGVMAFSNSGNDETRRDAIRLLEMFNEPSISIKYVGDTIAKKLLNNGTEKVLSIINYNTDSNLPSYVLGAQSFSFVEAKQYKMISGKSDIKDGMVLEYLNNDKWIPKKVQNSDEEFEKFYKILIKYNKVRTSI